METRKELYKSVRLLHRLQRKHRKKIKKVEDTQHKLKAQTQKIKLLEAKMVRIEHRVSSLDGGNGHSGLRVKSGLKNARLIFKSNPTSNGKDDRSLEKVVEGLRRHGIRAKVCLKISGKAARDCARRAVEKNEGLVIVAGGDGTIEDVASELVGSKTALGILPLGTRNNLARSLGIPLNLEEACSLLGAGITRQIDAGRVAQGEKPQIGYFLETAGFGLAGIVLPAGQAASKGNWAGLPSAISKLFELKPEPVEIQLDDGEVIKANTQLVTVSNAPYTGTNILIAPEAKMDDGLLDIAVYDGMGKTDLMGYFVQSTNGKGAENPNVRFYRARHIVIRSNQEMPVVSDKDPIPEHRVLEIEVIPHGLAVVAGKGIALSLPVDAAAISPALVSTPEMETKGAEAI